MATQNQSIGGQVSEQVKNLFAEKSDILTVIKEDHKPLKELIEIMKDSDKSVEERQQAFSEFAPLLLTHAKAEEQALYDFLKTQDDEELRESAFEGDTEHSMADQLCEEIKRTTNTDALGAKIKVLAEAVEHHIKEEENDFIPEIKKKISEDTLKALTSKYVQVQTEIISQGQDDSPRENEVNPQATH